MSEKDFSAITVKELSKRADLDRKTFYRNFRSKEEVLYLILEEMCQRYIQILKELPKLCAYECTKAYFSLCVEYADFFMLLKHHNLLPLVLMKFDEYLPALNNIFINDPAYADLSHADLSEALLDDAILDYADLRWANLNFAKLKNCSLHGAYLQMAQLDHADLSMTDLSSADLSEASLYCTILTKADLSNSSFVGSALKRVNLCEAELLYTDFSSASIIKTRITEFGLERAIYSASDFTSWDIIWVDIPLSQLSRHTDIFEALEDGYDLFDNYDYSLID